MELQALLAANADRDYAAFQAKLLPPGHLPLLGVRLPVLRKFARQLVREYGWDAPEQCGTATFEEVMLKGMALGLLDQPLETFLPRVDTFLSLVSDWSVCDSFCAGFKRAKAQPEALWPFVTAHLSDPRPYAVRFAVVMLLFYYSDAAHIGDVLPLLGGVAPGGYYIDMAVAWAISLCYVKFPGQTLPVLQGLPAWTRRKAVQKIRESRQAAPEQKQQLRRLLAQWETAAL